MPILLLQIVACAAMLAVGMIAYMSITPYKERELVRAGNVAGAITLGGAVLALAIPLAAILATSGRLIDIVAWGIVAIVLQLLTLLVVSLVLRHLRAMIEGGNVAAAILLAATQLAVALLNAAAMVPN